MLAAMTKSDRAAARSRSPRRRPDWCQSTLGWFKCRHVRCRDPQLTGEFCALQRLNGILVTAADEIDVLVWDGERPFQGARFATEKCCAITSSSR
jgi:hypothetical protein